MTDGFGRLAKPYRWMEYLTFGRALENCRFRFLRDVAETHSALVLGDGDGRFTARLLRTAPVCRVHAVDGSPAMLRALQARCSEGNRLTTYCADLAKDLPVAVRGLRFDLVASHFFLDCLSTAEVDALVERVRPLMQPGGRWAVSEFNIPQGPMRLPATLIVRGLYVGFRALAGLRTQHLPDYRTALQRHGFACRTRVHSLQGLLVSELWTLGNSSPIEVTRLE